MNIKINIPEEVHVIINTLNLAGFEAYIVGGCVRDSLLGRAPKDWDITTSAKPEQVKALFPKTYDTGIQHGTVSIRITKETYEVTTYRIDGAYTDFRRPDEVQYTSDLREDLKRRDFTMNAMAYHPKQGIIDYYGGKEDLEWGVIRCVGNPTDRFNEDALRMLRALRFSAQLNFEIEPATFKAITMMAELIRFVSWERIYDELNKLLLSDHPEHMRRVEQAGLMQYIMPEWLPCVTTEQHHPYHVYTVAEHTLAALQCVSPERILRWTVLLHDIGKPDCRTVDERGRDHFRGHAEKSAEMGDRILRRLKFDNNSREQILRLIRFHDVDMPQNGQDLRALLHDLGKDNFRDLCAVKRADAQAQNPEFAAATLAAIDRSEAVFEKILADGDAVCLAELKINGRDLKQLGFPAGRIIGIVLEQLMQEVLRDPSLNEIVTLSALARGLLEAPEIKKLL